MDNYYGPLLFFAGYLLHKTLGNGKGSVEKTVTRTGNFDVSDAAPDLSEEQLEFYREWTGSLDREFILTQWRLVKAKFHTYCCIQSMSYLNPRSKSLPLYNSILDFYHNQGSINIADVGTCFGQDTRNLILKGIPPSSIYAIDIHDGYWNAGLQLFKDDIKKNGPMNSVNKCFFDMSLPIGDDLAIESTNPESVSFFDFVLMVAVLHTMSREQQILSLTRVHYILRKTSGIVMGNCAGSKIAGHWLLTPDGSNPRYLNSVQSLTEILEEVGFSQIKVDERPQRGLGDLSQRPKVPMDDKRERIFIEFSAVA